MARRCTIPTDARAASHAGQASGRRGLSLVSGLELFRLGSAAWRTGDIQFGEAAGRDRADGFGNLVHIGLEVGPLRVAQNNDGDLATLQVLLIAHVLALRHQQVEPGFFRCAQQRAVGEFVQTLCARLLDSMAGQETFQPMRNPVVKQDEHLRCERRGCPGCA